MSDDRNILDFIRSLCANRETGRLEILAGAIQGELSFSEGKLVDARVGHLTGFRAINAVAAMRDARFGFDPAFTPLASGSITASERVVLKQFFGIETAATGEYLEPVATSFVEPQEDAPVAAIPDQLDEVTIVRSDARKAAIPAPPPPASRFSSRPALAFAILAIALIAAGAVLIYKLNQRGPAPVVASVTSVESAPVKQPEPVAPVKQPEPVAVASTPTRSEPAPAVVKRDEKPVNTARDLSGRWTVVNTIESTSYSSFKNMKIGFAMSIDQKGTSFTGSGHKVSENGRSLPAGSRTPIQVKGLIKGDRIEATFIEAGTARKSNGKFVWRLDQHGRGLNGSFATTAARSSGKSAAIRM
ncbi:MAG TPA: DUF4388 domain-containing protein [Pyrinomonadaceae bacterium]|nr:DUF4388 domain-containing protein [Pyrinomonadaceae bacterium]